MLVYWVSRVKNRGLWQKYPQMPSAPVPGFRIPLDNGPRYFSRISRETVIHTPGPGSSIVLGYTVLLIACQIPCMRDGEPALHGSVLFLFGAPDTIIEFFQVQGGSNRAGRAEAAFLIERAGRRFSRYAEKQALIGPHAFIVAGTGLADTPSPVLLDDCFQLSLHDTHPAQLFCQTISSLSGSSFIIKSCLRHW